MSEPKKMKMCGPCVIVGMIFFAVLVISIIQSNPSPMSKEPQLSQAEAQAIIDASEDRTQIEDDVWKAALDPEVYDILWNKGTEPPGCSPLLAQSGTGTYVSFACEIPVFRSEHKFDSGTGWPSFYDAIQENIILKEDNSHFMTRTEILSKCGEHLGHVFPDGPEPTGLRYCINGKALKFIPDEE